MSNRSSGFASLPSSNSRSSLRPLSSVARAALGITASALLLVGCATSNASDTPESPTEHSASTAPEVSYPVTVDNCGTEVTFEAAPTSVVTAKSSTTEALLALGLGETITATSFPDGPLPAWLMGEGEKFPSVTTPLSDQLPSLENVLELSPDLVFVGWESNLSADGIGPRETFSQLGVNTYVAPSACKEPKYQPDPLTYEHVFADITEIGEIFGVPERAEQVVTAQREELAQVVPDSRGLSALWFSSGSKTPFVGGGIGSAQLAMDSVGLTNIAADIDDSWGSMSWEKVIEADPDVIVLVDSAWGSTEKKIGVLQDNPVTAQLTAVVNSRYLVVPFPATEAAVRSVSAATDLAEQLSKLDLSEQK